MPGLPGTPGGPSEPCRITYILINDLAHYYYMESFASGPHEQRTVVDYPSGKHGVILSTRDLQFCPARNLLLTKLAQLRWLDIGPLFSLLL